MLVQMTATKKITIDPTKPMLIKDAKKITGGIGFTAKTGFSYGLAAIATCKIGAALAKKKGSTCFGCYAVGGNYAYPSTKTAHQNRYESVVFLSDPAFRKLWVEAMRTLIMNIAKRHDKDMWFFRWHDSGDIISVDHLAAIADVAKATPEVKHWLPSKEKVKVKEYLKDNKFPKNLCVRMSYYFIDKENEFGFETPVAGVYKDTTPKGHKCPAVIEHKGCHEVGCRACWNPKVKKVFYKMHR